MSAVLMNTTSSCEHDMPCPPPCGHNHWCDLRTRKNFKMLLCHVCFAKWKVCACRCAHNTCNHWAKRGTCSLGASCTKLHVAHSRPRALREDTPAAETPFTDAPTVLDAMPVAPCCPSPPYPVASDAPLTAFLGDCGDVPHAICQEHCRPSPQCDPTSSLRSETASLSPTSSSSGRSLRLVATWAWTWAPPACISACGEYLEEMDGYEPEGVAMTEEQLDALLRRRSLV
eukprot:TRINITY_DN2854_c0_g1_i10.p1 TRINITY_DN2854_c0_g1~~TRINITY_DN2854_c0_g1_i10.p1  ORF type:complete len:229 (+),score=49.03 TRINITY_DN2854_c0_g1_i10:89-775(+)